MTRLTRRGALAAGTSTLAALAGCASVPFLGREDDALPDYDSLQLADAVRGSRVDPLDPYPGTVPQALLERHRERARALLDDVPESPSFPNEAVTEELRRKRERAAGLVADEPVPTDPGVGDADSWEYARSVAAEASFAYRAASGEFDGADAAAWRRRLRDDYRATDTDLAYTGETVAEAVVGPGRLETELQGVRHSIAPSQTFPTEPRLQPFVAGNAAGTLEEGDAILATVSALTEARRQEDETDHWNAVVTATGVLGNVYDATREAEAPYLFEGAEAGEVLADSDVHDTPAGELFRLAESNATRGGREAEAAEGRGDYAAAMLSYVRALVGTLAVARGVEATRDGEHGVPPDAAAVEAQRTVAVDALRDARAADPSALANDAAFPLRNVLGYADDRLAEQASDYEVVEATGKYAYVQYAAEAVPDVVDRVARELREAE